MLIQTLSPIGVDLAAAQETPAASHVTPPQKLYFSSMGDNTCIAARIKKKAIRMGRSPLRACMRRGLDAQ